jgi:hypothetical protein
VSCREQTESPFDQVVRELAQETPPRIITLERHTDIDLEDAERNYPELSENLQRARYNLSRLQKGNVSSDGTGINQAERNLYIVERQNLARVRLWLEKD